MDTSQQKAQFSIAYFHAVTTICGLKLFRCDVDDESIDITVGKTGGAGSMRSPRLDVQLKCSGRELLKPDGLRHNAWWMNLTGVEEKAGIERPTVVLPRAQLFHPASLADIMERVGRRELQ